ncbi:hypothetical protein GA0111570_103332 [Raineyella antarctica]|uniref:Uncharacterized protein n=1 Tax=Raineyella antarctica TaxID=1577474 RepID=A0A1G6GI71_9ACTN|nr:hypothetical protein [Raineyella antarctica]SDB81722.1 hypothetical protein GA0111570_103332 [Raineyella antarctica]
MTETPREQTPPEQTPPGQTPTGQTPPEQTPTGQTPPVAGTPYYDPQPMAMSYAEPGLVPNRLIFSERTDRAIGFLARVSAIYLIIGLVLLAIMVILMFTLGGGLMYGLRGGY